MMNIESNTIGKKPRRVIIPLISVMLVVSVAIGVIVGVKHKLSENHDEDHKAISTTTKTIAAVCTETNHKKLCVDTMGGLANNQNASPLEFLTAAITTTIQEIKAAMGTPTEIGKVVHDSLQKMAVEDCHSLLTDAVFELHTSFSIVGRIKAQSISGRQADLKTWLSAVISYQDTCVDGFTTPELKNKIFNALQNSTKLTNNALAIVNSFSRIIQKLRIPLVSDVADALQQLGRRNENKNDVAWGHEVGNTDEEQTEIGSRNEDQTEAGSRNGGQTEAGSKNNDQNGTDSRNEGQTETGSKNEDQNEIGSGNEDQNEAGSTREDQDKGGNKKEGREESGKKKGDRKKGDKSNEGHNEAGKSDSSGFPDWVPAQDKNMLGSQNTSNPQPNVVVAKDGSGQYKTITEALAAYPKDLRGRYIIYVKAGVYDEYITITKKHPNIYMYGDGPRKTIITGNKSFAKGVSTYRTASFSVMGNGFIGKSLGFQNTAGPEGHQAVALRVQADMSVFYNCRMDGYQDTLYVQTHRQFYRSCVISGTIDFIFGDAAVVLQNCLIIVRKPMDNQKNILTAQGRSQSQQATGIVIQNCKVVPEEALEPVKFKIPTYLGRPWKEYSRTIIMETTLPDFIHPEGWFPWQGTFALDTLYYREYSNQGPGSSISKRVNWKGYGEIKNKEEALQFTAGQFIQGGEWLTTTDVPYFLGFTN